MPSLPEVPGAAAPGAEAATAPRFYANSPWELPQPFAHQSERDALRAGVVPACDAREPELAWLFAHFAVRRIFEGDLDAAEAIAERLDDARSARLLATIDLARAERAAQANDPAGARAAALGALTRIEKLDSAGSSYLASHVRLVWLTHEGNLELSATWAILSLRRALRRFGDLSFLYLALAHAQALLGRHQEALDEMGRALYYARGDAFYARAILDDGFVWRTRPALASQCRALSEQHQPTGALSPDEPRR